jgi:hypothetical protein
MSKTIKERTNAQGVAKKVWALAAWHFWSHWFRSVLSHTFAVFLFQQSALPILRFAELVTD